MSYRLSPANVRRIQAGKRPRRPSRDLEHGYQVALFCWIRTERLRDHRLRNCFAIPNGGKRNIVTAVRLKAEGVESGVPDVCLAWPAGGLHGLYIEMKSDDGRASKEQREWRDRLTAAGYRVVECRSCAEAQAAIEEYLRC